VEAVTIINGPVQVIAGAGSGKTKVLTARIAYLIENGINPREILALTFTNKAAREMKERIATYVGSHVSERIWAGTFHSIFARILRIECDYLGYTNNFSIYDTDDSTSLIKEILKELKISTQEYPASSIHSYISRGKNELMDPDQMANIADNTYKKTVAKIYSEYQHRLKKNNAMDFDDLLLNTLMLLTENPKLLEKYQHHFKYILVDEFQDTNKPQYLIVWNLAKAHSNLFVVGDDAQSIYRWRGAEIRNILNFAKDFPMTKMVRLEQNYRSTSTILDAAHSIIINNPHQIPKKLWTENEKGDKLDIIASEDDAMEGDRLAIQIINLLEKKFDYQDMAILYRTNAQSLLLERALRLRNIPYQVYGGMSFYQRKEIKDVVAYLRLLINPDDSVSLLRIVNEPPRGIGKTSMDHIITYSRLRDLSMYDAFLEAGQIGELQQRARKAAIEFAEMIRNYRDALVTDSLDVVVKDYIFETGLLNMYKELDTDESNDRWNNIQQLLNDIIRFAKDNPGFTLSDYLQQVSLLTDFDTKDTSTDKVTLMTLHTAKGLEFPVVMISGMEKGLFPILRNHLSKEEEEEERRLFYVGITRAKKKLFLSYAKRRSRFGEYQSQSPSGFLYELNKDLLVWTDPQFSPLRGAPQNPMGTFGTKQSPKSWENDLRSSMKPPSFGGAADSKKYFDDEPASENYSQDPEDSVLKKGDKVRHAHFGEGFVVTITGTGQSAKIMVDFASVGRKQLMLAFAKLQKT
jgi:DNA helicase-2/ATP-dependent DNA helicase PcrA